LSEEQKAIKNNPAKPCMTDMLVFALVWIPYAFLVKKFWWVCDDAFISFRYAFNWAAGNGLRFNLGDHTPVEGYSNFLWVAVCTIVEYFKADITFWPLIISFICGSILLYLVFATVRYRLGLSLTLSSITTLLLGCSPQFAVWSTSGLATIPFALLIFVTFERLTLRRDNIAPISAGIFGLMLALMRVEGIYWAILLVPIAIISRRVALQKFFKEILIYLLIVIIGYAVYWTARYSYYHLPFANTVYVKVSMSPATLIRGFDYVAHLFLSILPLFIIFPGIEIATRKKRIPLCFEVAMIPLVAIVYSILVSGDFMPMGRFLVPCLAFNAILFGWLIQDLFRKYPARKQMIMLMGAVIILIGLLPAWDIHVLPEAFRKRVAFERLNKEIEYLSEYQKWLHIKKNAELWTEKGFYFKNKANLGDTLVQGGIGAVGYYSGLFIYDRFGLVTRSVVINTDSKVGMPGHDKKVKKDFFLDQEPAFLWARETSEEKLRNDVEKIMSVIPEQYFLKIVKMSTKDVDGNTMYLVIHKRIKEGVNLETARKKTFKQLNEMLNGKQL